MDDYYELLGVDDDAPVDDITAAYRDKKAEVAALGTDAAKADAAALNKAWNVLSDPYQRGRYDQQRGERRATVDDDDDDDDDGDGDARPSRAGPADEGRTAAPTRARPPAAEPTDRRCRPAWRFPGTRRRTSRCSSTSAC